VAVSFGHPLPFMAFSIPWRLWLIFSLTSCINFCKWPAGSRRSPLC
jgi:hypothetical protein